MTSATLDTRFDHFDIPTREPAPSRKSIPILDDMDEDIQLFRVLQPSRNLPPGPTPVSESHHPVLDVDRMVVSASMIRRIQHELTHDECDPRTVFKFCRGLTKGSIGFEEAYFTARIRAFAKHQRPATDPYLHAQLNAEDSPFNSYQSFMNHINYPSNPMIVSKLGHLMSHFGIWVVGLLGVQAIASWRIGAFASANLDGGRNFHFGLALLLMLTLNSAVWLRLRGRLCDAFWVPGIALYLVALLPIFLLHVRAIWLAG